MKFKILMQFFRKMILVARIMVPKQRVLTIAKFCWVCQKCLEKASTAHVSDGSKVRNIRFRIPQEVALALEKEFFKNLNISIFP